MKHLKIGITAVALLIGLISSFTSKASRAVGSYITTAISHRVFAPGTVCTGTQAFCGRLHTVGGKTLGPVFTNK
ncbi:hypothetical protein ECE50_008900 [Chitinophaga sp. Mgbs1]|uniref:Uncharacterized protein n=1 Tax=Chitinophaga solisilvae TaxID=1233460 RepID=A0A9Q5GL44_9BACT|nr:hypothetical protein [Chitinophaga solisilvae]